MARSQANEWTHYFIFLKTFVCKPNTTSTKHWGITPLSPLPGSSCIPEGSTSELSSCSCPRATRQPTYPLPPEKRSAHKNTFDHNKSSPCDTRISTRLDSSAIQTLRRSALPSECATAASHTSSTAKATTWHSLSAST